MLLLSWWRGCLVEMGGYAVYLTLAISSFQAVKIIGLHVLAYWYGM